VYEICYINKIALPSIKQTLTPLGSS